MKRPHARGWDDMKDSNLSHSACVCADEDTTTYLRECARRSVEVVAGVCIVRCHAIMNVVIDVRVVECHASMDVVIGVRVVKCHASMDVVIGVRVVLCHQAIKFPLSEFSTSCSNSHLVVHAVSIHHHFSP